MNPFRDSSIAGRLTLGYGAVVAVLAVFAVVTFISLQRSGEAQRDYTRGIMPRAEAASDLERSVFQVAIAWRNWFLSPDNEHAAATQAAIDGARQSLQTLGRLPKDADGEQLFEVLEPAVQRYLAEVASALRTAAVSNPKALEDSLSVARTTAMNAIGAYTSLKRYKAHRAIEAMEASRERVTTALVFAFATVALMLLALGIFAMAAIRRPARRLTQIANDIQAGEWNSALQLSPTAAKARGEDISPRNEFARISLAFGAAAEALERREERLRADARMAGAAAASLDKAVIAEQALIAMTEATGAPVGVIYWRDADGETLHPIASRGLAEDAALARLGEGLPGLAAREGRVLVVRDIPPDSPMTIRAGIADLTPHSIVAVPAILRHELHGVAVLACLRELDDHALEILKSAGLQLAIGLANARTHEHVRSLLTQVRQVRERLQRQNEELQQQSEELQAQNEEIQAQTEELQATTRQLAEADERKNEFIGILAHELRNPLSAIANGVFILGQAPGRPETEAQILGLIRRQLTQLARLMDDLLDVSRIAHGKLELHREVIDLRDLVNEGVNDLRPAAAKARLALEANVPSTPVHAKVDRTRLMQVLGNLVGNAMKFTEAGGRIDVVLRRNADDSACIVVRDTGAGIEPAMLDKLFQPFVQGHAPRSQANGGLGLGLALAKALAMLHDGAIEARSKGAGHGAEFIVTLPTTHEQPTPSIPGAHTGGYRISRRILLIEDNPDAAEALQTALTIKGHDVELAHTGFEGVEKACAMAPDVVLCDLAIPGIDGFEVARRVRADPRLAGTPLIALSGYASADDKQRSRDAGFDEHLSKPIAMESLLEAIARHAAAPRSVTA